MRKLIVFGLVMIVLAGSVFPVVPVLNRAQAQSSSITSLVAVVFPGTKSAPAHFGVYLGHGLILTNWHPWTLDGRFYTDAESPVSPSRQVAQYDDDGATDPGEYLLGMAVCDGQWIPGDIEAASTDVCTDFARIDGAGFIFPGVGEMLGSDPVPVGRLIYASRARDIALLAVDAAAVEGRGVTPVRLSMARTGADAPVLAVYQAADQTPNVLATVLKTNVPQLLPNIDRRVLGAPWQVQSLVLSAPEVVPDGTPVFDKASGDLVGVLWRADDVDPAQRWLTPAAIWIHDLYAANESIQSPALAMVLAESTVGSADGALTRHDPLAPSLGNDGIDVQHVVLELAFDLETRSLAGTAMLDIRATHHRLTTFALDASGLEISRIRLNGVDAPFAAKTEKLLVQMPADPVDYGTVFQVMIDYRAAPQSFRSAYMPFFDIGMFWGEDTVSTLDQPDGAHWWFPINDHPSDRATYDFRFRVAEPLTAVANGRLIETVAHGDGTRTFHWQMDQPMASYLTVVAIANYVAIEEQAPDGTPVTHYVYSDQALAGREVFGYTDEALIMLEEWFGPYPYTTYGHVIAPVVGMALETQAMTTMPDTVMTWTELEIYELMVHELTHQWFGNTVTPGVWSDIWLNEGFARYSQWLARDERFGAEAALAARSASEQRMISDSRRTPLFDPLPDETFGIATYDKGGWVLHMLRGEIGDEAFFKLLRTYVVTFYDRPVTTLGFWQLAEQISGQDLAQFFTQWVLQAENIPNLRLYWTETESGADVLLCPTEIERYHLDVPVRFVGDIETLDTVITLDNIKGAEASFTLDFVPRELRADPAQAMLAQVQVQPTALLPVECWGGL